MRFLISFVFILSTLLYSPFGVAQFKSKDAAYINLANLLTNPGAELGKSGWTASAGTYTTTTTAANVGSGSAAFGWDAAASGNTWTGTAFAVTPGLYGKNGALTCNIQTPSGSATHSLQVTDGTNILSTAAITSSTGYSRTTINFPFPSSGSVYPRLYANANEPQIYIDDCVFGDAQFVNIFMVDTSATPTQQRFTSGTAQTYTVPAGVSYIRVRMVGGGGGGGGSATAAANNATAGNASTASTASTFGSSLLTASAGAGGGCCTNRGGAGGTFTINSPAFGTGYEGGDGGNAGNVGTLVGALAGGVGGTSYLGGNGGGSGAAGTPGGYGSGGGGGEAPSLGYPGSGGGAAGGIDAFITGSNLAATYTYTVGVAGSAGAAGTSGSAGGAGGAGYIEVTEYYTPTKGLAIAANQLSFPTVQILDSGTAATYTLPTNPRPAYIIVEMIGAGGAGGPSGTGSYGSGANGDNSTWGDGVSTNTAAGGFVGGVGAGGAGGTNTINFGTQLVGMAGSAGAGSIGSISDTTSGYVPGGLGGAGFFGGGCSSVYGGAGGNATANSGSGGCGGGGAPTANIYLGAGGGAGAYQKVLFTNPKATYTYTVGAGKTGATAGTNGYACGNSGAGRIIVTEYYGNNAPILVGEPRYTAQTTTYAASIGDYVDATSGTFTVTLPTAVGWGGKSITLKNSGTGIITIATTSSQTIDGMASGKITMPIRYSYAEFVSNGTNWTQKKAAPVVAKFQCTSHSMTSGATTVINFATSIIDTHAAVATGAGWTFTAPMAGYYLIQSSVSSNYTATSAVTAQFMLFLYKAGSAAQLLGGRNWDSAVNGMADASGGTVISLAKDDTIDIRTSQNSGGTQTLNTGPTYNHVSITMLQ